MVAVLSMIWVAATSDKRLGVVASGRFSRPSIRVAHGRGAGAVKFAGSFPSVNVSRVVTDVRLFGRAKLNEARTPAFELPEFKGARLDAKSRRSGVIIECCGQVVSSFPP